MYKISHRKVQFEIHRLEAAGFPKPALGKIKAAIKEFLAEPGRRPGKRARRVLERLWSAYWHRDRHTDDNVKRKARKLVKTANHSVSFDDLEAGAKAFARALNTADRRIEEEAMLREAEWREAGDGQLQQVVSFGQLCSIGRELGLCVRRKSWARHFLGQVEGGDTELWLLWMDGVRHTLIEVNADDRSVSKCETSDGETPEFTARQARAILTALKASGDDNGAFTSVGAYSAFRGNLPPQTRIFDLCDNRQLRVWRYPDEIITAVRNDKVREVWTRVRRNGGRWEDDCSDLSLEALLRDDDEEGGFGLGELFELALTRPEICGKLQPIS